MQSTRGRDESRPMELLQELAHGRYCNVRPLGDSGGGLHARRLLRQGRQDHRRVVGQLADTEHAHLTHK